MSIFAFILGVTPLFGGPRDKPIIWRGGGNYHFVANEIYWKKVFEENGGGSFAYENATGGYAKIDFVLLRFETEEKYRYATRTHAHLEFARKTQKFLTPKGLYMGYGVELYTISGSTGLGNVRTRITSPGSISLGIFTGVLPVYPYLSLNVGASFVSEYWYLVKEIPRGPQTDIAESTGFWGIGRAGLFYQVRSHFALDLSLTYSHLSFRHTKGESIPNTQEPMKGDNLQEFKIGLGLIFAMPWKVEKTIR